MTAPAGRSAEAWPRLESAARRYWAAMANRNNARNELQYEVLAALDLGISEVEAARIAGVSRMTVRAWRKAD